MKKKKEKSIKKKSFPEVTASRIKPEKKRGGFTSSQEKETIGKKTENEKKNLMKCHPITSVSAVENQCSRIQFL